MTVARPVSGLDEARRHAADGVDAARQYDANASLVRGQARYFLVYRNYEAILAYNCSNSYGVSVGLLADQIGKT